MRVFSVFGAGAMALLLGCIDDPRDENPPESLHENICLSLRLQAQTVVLKEDAAVDLKLLPSGQAVEFPFFQGDDVMAIGTFRASRDGEVILAQIDSRPSRNLARFSEADGSPGGGITEDVRCEGLVEDPPVLAFRRHVRRGERYHVRFDGQSQFGVNFYLDFVDNWVNWDE
jgi:hypothetical protein